MIGELKHQFEASRLAQQSWQQLTTTQRCVFLSPLKDHLLENAQELCLASSPHLPLSETLTSQFIPLLDAICYLQKKSVRILRAKTLSVLDRPLWLWGVNQTIHRVPHGCVLIIAPSNYPLFLPWVQALQALVAGNSVWIKPGMNGSQTAQLMQALIQKCGLPNGLIHVLDESVETAQAALELDWDHVVFTGSSSTGTQIAQTLALRSIPLTAELSGCDAMFILDESSMECASQALAFGLSLHHSCTCIAPRRIFIPSALMEPFIRCLKKYLVRAVPVSLKSQQRAKELLEDARLHQLDCVLGDSLQVEHGAWIFKAKPQHCSTAKVLCEDYFLPIATLIPYEDLAQANTLYHQCPYALGASIFGKEQEARPFAQTITAGVVTINDVIAPTADSRLPFGGTKKSGYGVTRGKEGLLNMTRPQVISTRKKPSTLHYQDPSKIPSSLILTFAQLLHSSNPIASLSKTLLKGFKR